MPAPMVGMTTSPARKKHTGEPGNGGEFGSGPRPESAAVLTAAADAAHSQGMSDTTLLGFDHLARGDIFTARFSASDPNDPNQTVKDAEYRFIDMEPGESVVALDLEYMGQNYFWWNEELNCFTASRGGSRVDVVAPAPKLAPVEPTLLAEHKLVPHTRLPDSLLYRRENLEMNPPYQRGSVWDTARRQALLKSMLMGIPVGAIVLNKRPTMEVPYIAVVDGKQRIETLRALMDGEFGIPAAWVSEQWRGETQPIEYDGQTVDGIVIDNDRHPFMGRLMNFPLSVIEASVPTVEQEAEIFRLVNSGGVAQDDDTMARAAVVESGE
jgi:hypothetical protein